MIHPIPPLYNENAKVLILGSFPSVKSREEGFFYGHPQNRFWRVLFEVLSKYENKSAPENITVNSNTVSSLTERQKELPKTINEKTAFILNNKIALWDVIASCEIVGSSDSSIRNVIPNDISPILKSANIKAIFTNGSTAHRLYKKYILPETGIADIQLPSTSPANATWSIDKLTEAWQCIGEVLEH